MKRILLITFMLLSIAGFSTEIGKPVQQPAGLEKGTKQNISLKSEPALPSLDRETLPNDADQLIAEFQQIMLLLDKKLPGWNRESKLNDKHQQIIKTFVTSLELSVKYNSDKYQPPKLNTKFNPLPLLWLEQKKIAYLRIDGFNPEVLFQFRQIHDILVSNYRLTGLIIDLRNCRSFDYKNGVKCLKQIIDAYKATSPAKVRLAILVGSRTLGVPEYFIHRLQQTIKPVLVGRKSAGQPFEYQNEKLTGGGYLLLPCIPVNISNQASLTAQIPTIKIINNSQSEYKNQHSKPDVTVKYASELLIALKATSGNPSEF